MVIQFAYIPGSVGISTKPACASSFSFFTKWQHRKAQPIFIVIGYIHDGGAAVRKGIEKSRRSDLYISQKAYL